MLLSKKEQEQFIEDYKSLSTKQIKHKWGCTNHSVLYWARKLGIWDRKLRNRLSHLAAAKERRDED